MPNIRDAVDSVRLMARWADQLKQVVEVLDQVGALEHAVNEKQTYVDRLREEANALELKIADGKAAVEAAQAEAERIITNARGEGDKVWREKNIEADGLITAATAARDKVHLDIDRQLAEADDKLKMREARLAELDAAVAEKQAQLDAIEQHRADLVAKLGG